MKTIEERAYSRYASDECCRDCENCEDRVNCFDADYVLAFIAGAQSEHKELTRWNSPYCPPEDHREILVKVKNGYNIASYNPDKGYCVKEGFYTEILGWREIHE